MRCRSALVLLPVLAAVACGSSREALDAVPAGTWGAEEAGLIVRAEGSHAHIGCTLGDTAGLIPVDAEGRFDVAGEWNVDAFPIDQGIVHPARWTGQTDGRTLSLSVRLTDTGRVIGPVFLTLGREPQMANCPICRVPTPRRRR
jgi:hypothetical protein